MDDNLRIRLEEIGKSSLRNMQKISNDGLDVDYAILLPEALADELLQQMESTLEYYEGDLTKVKVFGKWHQIPRQQVAYGNDGLKYRFSGTTVPAKPWNSLLDSVRSLIEEVTGFQYNFVLINRYRNGNDHIGEHRDDEGELDQNTPIASLSLGQKRTFVLKHSHSKLKRGPNKNLAPIKIDLEHGSLLLMNPPTNKNWYHSLPPRKSASGVRINLTFRKINSFQS